MDNSKKVAFLIACIDYRINFKALAESIYLYTFDIDAIPGPEAVLSRKIWNQETRSYYKNAALKAAASNQIHGSKVIVLMAHEDCAGNHVEKNIQLEDLEKAGNQILKDQCFSFINEVELAYVDLIGDQWSPRKIKTLTRELSLVN